MGYTRNLIEIMRGIHPICCDFIIDVISSHKKCEEMYEDIFSAYGLEFSTENIKQKRAFVAAVTEYYILRRCNTIKQIEPNGKYNCSKSPRNKKAIENAINAYFEVKEGCTSNQDLKEKYAKFYNEEVRDFSEEIRINRDDNLSDFSKAVEQFYYNKD